jgi:hypothetical protein
VWTEVEGPDDPPSKREVKIGGQRRRILEGGEGRMRLTTVVIVGYLSLRWLYLIYTPEDPSTALEWPKYSNSTCNAFLPALPSPANPNAERPPNSSVSAGLFWLARELQRRNRQLQGEQTSHHFSGSWGWNQFASSLLRIYLL